MIPKSKPEATRSAADGSSLGRARRVLGSLGERLLEAFTDGSAQEAEHKQRLRGVLLRDRELLAGDHDRARHGDGSAVDPVVAPAAPTAAAPQAAPARAEAIPAVPAPALSAAPARPSEPAPSVSSAPRRAATPWSAPPPSPKRAKGPSAGSQTPPPPLPRPAATQSAAPSARPVEVAPTSVTSASPAASAPSARPVEVAPASVTSASPAASAPATAHGVSGAAAPVVVARAADDSEAVLDEPIRTRSMARLLAGQGHLRRALAIYDALLAEPGADDSLRAEADALRVRLAT